jgi:hypothetical protein
LNSTALPQNEHSGPQAPMLSDGGGTICREKRGMRSRIAAEETSSRASGRSHSMDAPTRRLAQYHKTLNPSRPCQSWRIVRNLGRDDVVCAQPQAKWQSRASALRRTGCKLSRQDCCTCCLHASTLVHIFIDLPLTLPSRCTTSCNSCVHSSTAARPAGHRS